MPTYPSRDEYRRVRKAEGEKEKGQGPENEIRVTSKHGQRSYIAYAIALLRGEEGKTQYDTVKISAMGAAIHNAVNIAEIVKRRVAGLHQTTDISSEVIRDEYEPVDEKKERLEVERKVSTILITLSLKPLDKNHVGYQPPLPEEEVKEQEEREPGESTAGGRGRGPRNATRGGGSRGSGGAARGSSRGGGNYGGQRGSGRGGSRGGASRGAA
ncbi:uncharacterized protein TM35_000015340 [Trypanosoma theileri]|uniref:DNA/RNA-binding protein Alba-like domain-containing protein n=1 Tax=Trypanosoma theileri TaxID=67003 RepID=A0A1X0P9P6_9TRYP|nr:uncharacterized protein TM35_000015340 [Trypanosoma theileri]ORC93657.1 hypothetical protein TM35_000015340 [Trypanosoma theileri]